MIWTAPRFPIFSWVPAPTGSVTITSNATTTEIQCSTLAGHGFKKTSGDTYTAHADSLHGKLAAAVATKTGSTTSAMYQWPSGDAGPLRVRMFRTGGHTSCTLTFSTAAAAAAFGYDGVGPHSLPEGVTGAITDHNHAGVWRPCAFGGFGEEIPEQPSVGWSDGAMGTTPPQVWSWGAVRNRLEMLFEAVRAANIRRDAATETAYATAALRSTSDENATLAAMLGELWENRASSCVLWTQQDVSQAVYFDKVPKSLKEIATESAAGTVYAVRLSVRL